MLVWKGKSRNYLPLIVILNLELSSNFRYRIKSTEATVEALVERDDFEEAAAFHGDLQVMSPPPRSFCKLVVVWSGGLSVSLCLMLIFKVLSHDPMRLIVILCRL